MKYGKGVNKMYNNASSPIVVISNSAAKKIFDKPQDLTNKAAAIKKVRKDLKKVGFFI